jgi:hypothetical protein
MFDLGSDLPDDTLVEMVRLPESEMQLNLQD